MLSWHDWRGGYDFMVSYNPRPFALNLPPTAHIVLGQTPLAPAGVLVWKEPSPAQ